MSELEVSDASRQSLIGDREHQLVMEAGVAPAARARRPYELGTVAGAGVGAEVRRHVIK